MIKLITHLTGHMNNADLRWLNNKSFQCDYTLIISMLIISTHLSCEQKGCTMFFYKNVAIFDDVIQQLAK